jgi:hypothetical protein
VRGDLDNNSGDRPGAPKSPPTAALLARCNRITTTVEAFRRSMWEESEWQ